MYVNSQRPSFSTSIVAAAPGATAGGASGAGFRQAASKQSPVRRTTRVSERAMAEIVAGARCPLSFAAMSRSVNRDELGAVATAERRVVLETARANGTDLAEHPRHQ